MTSPVKRTDVCPIRDDGCDFHFGVIRANDCAVLVVLSETAPQRPQRDIVPVMEVGEESMRGAIARGEDYLFKGVSVGMPSIILERR